MWVGLSLLATCPLRLSSPPSFVSTPALSQDRVGSGLGGGTISSLLVRTVLGGTYADESQFSGSVGVDGRSC
jgi:hypothetical protein